MPIVYACAMSHAPGITAWQEAAPPAQLKAVTDGFAQLHASFTAARPEKMLVLTSEHWANFFLDHVGAFCLGRAESYEGPVEPWLKLATRSIPGDPVLAKRLLEDAYSNGFELSHAHELRFDHGTMVPLNFLTPDFDVPLVPIIFNTLAPPRASAKRCYELGQVLRHSLDTSSERIAVVATGGMSHDPGERNHGFIDQAFDHRFLEQMSGGDARALAAYSDDQLMAAGAGATELLAWICLAGIMNARPAKTITYEPVTAWATGIGLVEYPSLTA
jgi:aromatic ring-opening dioxygenase catalytic subunit (LigB family)